MNRNLNTRLAAEPDESLVAQAQQGNPAALNELYQRHLNSLARLCMEMTGDANAVDDLLQDVYLKAYSSISSRPEQTPFHAWLRRVAVNTVRDWLKERRTSEYSPEETAADRLHREPSQEVNSIVRSAMRLLPLREREVLVLHDFRGLTFSEVADILQCPVGTVKARASRARQRLLKLLHTGAEDVIDSTPTSATQEASAVSPTERDQLIQQYHELIDKELNGKLSPKDAQALQKIEEQLQLIEDAETAEIEQVTEQRHHQIVQQLSDLTAELQKFSATTPGSKLQ
jgi:RNA polymerase sigma-70 factor, ECF subfamily